MALGNVETVSEQLHRAEQDWTLSSYLLSVWHSVVDLLQDRPGRFTRARSWWPRLGEVDAVGTDVHAGVSLRLATAEQKFLQVAKVHVAAVITPWWRRLLSRPSGDR